MSMTYTELALVVSVILNLVFLALWLGTLYGRRLVRPIEEATKELDRETAKLEAMASRVLEQYGYEEAE